MRYLIELASRKQRRTVSSFIEWALEESLSSITVEESSRHQESVTLADVQQTLWDVDDADRFAKLALRYPDMLNHHEQVLWKLVRENGYLWRGRPVKDQWTWEIKEGDLCYDRLRENWEKFNNVANGNADKSVLPTWSNTSSQAQKPPSKPASVLLDDEMPF